MSFFLVKCHSYFIDGIKKVEFHVYSETKDKVISCIDIDEKVNDI